VPGKRFVPGIRVGRPAAVWSPRTGALTVSAIRQPLTASPDALSLLPGEPTLAPMLVAGLAFSLVLMLAARLRPELVPELTAAPVTAARALALDGR
jgi:hypothetical protein